MLFLGLNFKKGGGGMVREAMGGTGTFSQKASSNTGNAAQYSYGSTTL
jgi:hypothetical protein